MLVKSQIRKKEINRLLINLQYKYNQNYIKHFSVLIVFINTIVFKII